MISQIKFIRNSQMQDAVSPALAIDPAALLSNIVRYYLSECQAADLALDDQIMNARYQARQIIRLFEFASKQLHIELSARDVGRVFEVSHTLVARAELRGYDDPPARGHHHEPSADCEQELVGWLANKAVNHRTIREKHYARMGRLFYDPPCTRAL
jgi:hypothetical protein